jgi:hypothetical protein
MLKKNSSNENQRATKAMTLLLAVAISAISVGFIADNQLGFSASPGSHALAK